MFVRCRFAENEAEISSESQQIEQKPEATAETQLNMKS